MDEIERSATFLIFRPSQSRHAVVISSRTWRLVCKVPNSYRIYIGRIGDDFLFPETGISSPRDGDFLADSTSSTSPDSSVLYPFFGVFRSGEKATVSSVQKRGSSRRFAM